MLGNSRGNWIVLELKKFMFVIMHYKGGSDSEIILKNLELSNHTGDEIETALAVCKET